MKKILASSSNVPLVNLLPGPRRYAPAEGRKYNSGTLEKRDLCASSVLRV